LKSHESAHWQASMKREVQQLENQGAWELVSHLPPGRKLIKGRWVYKKKLNTDNTVKEYKSRWVVKGFMQQEGIDYFETYAATLFPTTFRIVFSLAASNGWMLYQMDVTGAFLHSLLDSDIYMEPPEEFYTKGLICREDDDAAQSKGKAAVRGKNKGDGELADPNVSKYGRARKAPRRDY